MVEVVLIKYLYSNGGVDSVLGVVLVKYLYSNGGVDSVLRVVLVKYLYSNGGVDSMVEVEVSGGVGRPVGDPQVAVSHATVQLLLDAMLLPNTVKRPVGYHLLCEADYSVHAVSESIHL